jgi:hypothetical protein
MPIIKKWTLFNRENINRIPSGVCGMYEIANRDKILIYRGSSDSNTGIKSRLLAHLVNRRFPSARYFRYSEAGWLDTGLDMEARHTRRAGKPKYMKRTPRDRDIFGFPLD